MDIVLKAVGKRYRLEWIFRQLSYEFHSGGRYAILGPNGSGKSTLMKILSGHLSPSKGDISFQNSQQTFDRDELYRQISYAAPYIDLIEEFQLLEAIRFHQGFKPLLRNLNAEALVELLGFQEARQKEIRFFSSGMKQRLKLALAICSDTDLLLLDEPTTNLDAQGMDWYRGLVAEYGGERTIIVASNVAGDYAFCEESLNILDWKKRRK
ncbi:MAG: ABC transporter ATP-binding protein [Bacteroidota bacterium]